MITYPFKFRKLNRYIPAELITILIPFILNLFLNPVKELTTINETIFLSISDSVKYIPHYFLEFSVNEIPDTIKNAFAIGIILFGYTSFNDAPKSTDILCANALSGSFSGMPVRKHPVRGYGIFSAFVAFAVTSLLFFVFPEILSRLPLHCVGSMLIVSAWQSIPYKKLAEIFKRKNIIDILTFAICVVLFIMVDIFTATIAYLLIMFIHNKATPLGERSAKHEN
jgi:MFS superfamily sulfate permease-like transporter